MQHDGLLGRVHGPHNGVFIFEYLLALVWIVEDMHGHVVTAAFLVFVGAVRVDDDELTDDHPGNYTVIWVQLSRHAGHLFLLVLNKFEIILWVIFD